MCGSMDLERNKPWREDAIVRIYSMTKPITSVALMMLVEEGKLGLDDAVQTYIPSWKNLRVYASGDAEPCRKHRRPVHHHAVRAADEGRRSRHAHIGPDLRLHVAHRGRCGISPPEDQRLPDARRPGRLRRAAFENPARLLARQALELFGFDRRDGLSRPEALRHDVRRVPAHAAVRAAGHEGHRVLGAGVEDRAFRLAATCQSKAAD